MFFFFYAGHGRVSDDGQGLITLQDGMFSRDDLYREVIAASPAHLNHIIIDACNSYFMVNSRGSRAKSTRKAIRSFLWRRSLRGK